MPEAPRWARVRGDINCRVRRGAWYRVVQLTTDVAFLEAGERTLSVPRDLLRIVLVRPRDFAVVRRPYDAIDVPRQWGSRYGVCPSCQQRMPLDHDQVEAECGRCHMVGAIDWSESPGF